ncbi:glycosyltransferase family 4 protein [Streptomyces sp. TRM 70361]|uniref:glycosyltransferase family 4 protein n=1 Tax=Streptomyces sp. TRM 70361 TaxID=3116553 RepID=UPI002E7BAACC|nr:glycosyltransferase family 4 protein [Streptomyces sp. TRM 70361]MEE1941224.1 glycosyltransferase family 4 protein [Streptomyces sp. TRM 70361]
MRICFVSRRYWPAVSGMSAYAENLLRALTAAGHEVTLVAQYRGDRAGRAVYGGGPPPPGRVPEGVRLVALESLGEQAVNHGRPADFEADVAALREAVAALHERAPLDVVHAQYGYPPGLAALEASYLLGVPAVVSVQGGDGHWVGTCCGTHREAIRRVLREVPALLIGSRSFAAEVAERHRIPAGRFTVVPGATDTDLFRPRPGREPGAAGDPPVLLYHGRIDARKGVFELLEAVRLLLARGRRLRLLVSGTGPDADAVARRAREPELAAAVEVLGPAGYHEAPAVYHRGDVFVSPTWAEGFSNTILEAMATGLPVVSTRAVGVVDCVRDGVNGLLVPPRDPAALADAVGRLLDDPRLRGALARTALDQVRRHWSWPVAAARIGAVYERVLGDWTPHRPPGAGVPLRTAGSADPACRFRRAPHLL